MSEIRSWLEELGLGQYADAFEENEIDLDLARDLNDDTLEKIGVAAVGHRIRILRAISAHAGQGIAHHRPAQSKATKSREQGAERRQITVMFCDLVGSTALSEKLDPEELRDVMRAYQDACAGAIARFEGFIAQTLGDGLMVYFGFPLAHEDDAQRAVGAGLEIVDAVTSLSERLSEESGITLAVRVGIHTGVVVAGEIGGADTRGDKAVVGDTPNVAARVETLAAPNTVVVSSRTYRLIHTLFNFEDLGSRPLKGVEEPVALYRVTGKRLAESRFEAMHPADLTPFVGRGEEINLLKGRWGQVRDNEGQVVLLCGEPGIGKSRITSTFREMIANDEHTRVQYQCSPMFSNSAFYPIAQQLQFTAGFAANDSPEVKLDKLELVLARFANNVAETAPLFGAMLSLPIDRYSSPKLTPERQKELTIRALVDQLHGLSQEKPVLLIFEDVHWIDPTTLEVLDHVVAAISRLPVLLIVTFRPEFEPHWGAASHATLQTLNRLGRRQCISMIDRVSGSKSLPNLLKNEIVTKTDGVPLFIEELTKAVLESNIIVETDNNFEISGSVSEFAIPDTLHDSLMARLDRLIPVKEVAQIGAAIGREFSYQLLATLSPLSADELDVALEKLNESQLVYCRGVPPDATYTFKHALVQDSAYQSLLKSHRRKLHQNIAVALETKFPETAETQPELLARHYTEAKLADQAIPYWLAAGKQAVARSANKEAIQHLRQGLKLLSELQDSADREVRELEIQVALGPPSIILEGYGSLETIATYERAYQLSVKQNERDKRPAILFGLWVINNVASDHAKALQFADQAIEFSLEDEDTTGLMIARRSKGSTLLHQGKLTKSKAELEAAIALHDAERHRDLAYKYAQDPKVAGCVLLSWPMWLLGYPDQARQMVDEAFQAASSIRHAYTDLWAAFFGGVVVNAWCGDIKSAEANVRVIDKVSDENHNWLFQNYATITRAWIGANLGSVDLADDVEAAICQWRDHKHGVFTPLLLSMAAQSHFAFGRVSEGLDAIQHGLGFTSETGEAMMVAELNRLMGVGLRMRGDDAGAEKCFLAALEIARNQKARSWELRSAMSLARLWQIQAKSAQARDLLFPIYDWFTEGFDTSDLKAAKVRLDELT